MSSDILNDIRQLNGLSRYERVNFICLKIAESGIDHTLQKFESSFGKGINIIASAPLNASKHYKVLTAHYDGDSFFDNAGGVIMLLQLMRKINTQSLWHDFIIAFTDQEESFQQGSYHFLKEYPLSKQSIHFNIDGFGLGDRVYSMESFINPATNKEKYLTDCEAFLSKGHSSNSFFSSYACDYDEVVSGGKSVKSIFSKYIDEVFFLANFSEANFKKNSSSLWDIIYKS